jgi:hypothetical protein
MRQSASLSTSILPPLEQIFDILAYSTAGDGVDGHAQFARHGASVTVTIRRVYDSNNRQEEPVSRAAISRLDRIRVSSTASYSLWLQHQFTVWQSDPCLYEPHRTTPGDNVPSPASVTFHLQYAFRRTTHPASRRSGTPKACRKSQRPIVHVHLNSAQDAVTLRVWDQFTGP